MVINNMRSVEGIVVPKMFDGKVFIASDCLLDKSEIDLFNIAIQIVSEQLLIDMVRGFDDSIIGVNIFFSSGGIISYSPDLSMHEWGAYINTIVYLMENLREMDDRDFLLVAFIEEMTHHFWRIENEVTVKHKVIEIAKRYRKNIDLNIFRRYDILK